MQPIQNNHQTMSHMQHQQQQPSLQTFLHPYPQHLSQQIQQPMQQQTMFSNPQQSYQQQPQQQQPQQLSQQPGMFAVPIVPLIHQQQQQQIQMQQQMQSVPPSPIFTNTNSNIYQFEASTGFFGSKPTPPTTTTTMSRSGSNSSLSMSLSTSQFGNNTRSSPIPSSSSAVNRSQEDELPPTESMYDTSSFNPTGNEFAVPTGMGMSGLMKMKSGSPTSSILSQSNQQRQIQQQQQQLTPVGFASRPRSRVSSTTGAQTGMLVSSPSSQSLNQYETTTVSSLANTVTVFGFPPDMVEQIVQEFRRCGDILSYGCDGVALLSPSSLPASTVTPTNLPLSPTKPANTNTTTPSPLGTRAGKVNYVHIMFRNEFSVERALRRNGEMVLEGLLMIGVMRASRELVNEVMQLMSLNSNSSKSDEWHRKWSNSNSNSNSNLSQSVSSKDPLQNGNTNTNANTEPVTKETLNDESVVTGMKRRSLFAEPPLRKFAAPASPLVNPFTVQRQQQTQQFMQSPASANSSVTSTQNQNQSQNQNHSPAIRPSSSSSNLLAKSINALLGW